MSVSLTNFNDILLANAAAQTINAGAGDDTGDGGGGNDTISLSLGDDTVRGASGNDSIGGGIGNDILLGGSGNDTLVGDDAVLRDGTFYIVALSPTPLTQFDALLLAYSVNAESGLVAMETEAEFDTVLDILPTNFTAWTAGVRLPNAGGGEQGLFWQTRNGLVAIDYDDWTVDPWASGQPDGTVGESIRIRNDANPAFDGWSDWNTTSTNTGYVIETPILPDVNDVLAGDQGNDLVDGSLGNDTVRGGEGNDTLLGGSGDDSLVGDDWYEFGGKFYFFSQRDVTFNHALAISIATDLGGQLVAINSEAESDFVTSILSPFGATWTSGQRLGTTPFFDWGSGASAEIVTFTNWADGQPTGASSGDRIVLRNADDGQWQTLIGTNTTLVDSIVVELDALPMGLSLNDLMDGGAGQDTIAAGLGNDTATGGEGDDSVAGEGGDDIVQGGLGADTVDGGTGNDRANGGLGDDLVAGGEGNDTLGGGVGSDTVAGGAGDDLITGDDDWVTFDGRSYLLILGGTNFDASRLLAESQTADSSLASIQSPEENVFLTALLDGGQSVYVGGFQPPGSAEPAGGWVWRTRDGDIPFTFTNWRVGEPNNQGNENAVMFLDTGFWNDVPGGGALGGFIVEASTIVDVTASADDSLEGGEGNDTIQGGLGADTLIGGEGDDVLDGGSGADSMAGGLGNDRYILGQAGDQVFEAAGEGEDTIEAAVTRTLGADLEGLILTGSADIDGTGNGLANLLIGNRGDNVLSGENGSDSLDGERGDDTVDGGNGADTLTGGQGADLLQGGAGNDRYLIDADDTILDTAGTDTVEVGFSYALVADIETLVLSGGAAIDGTGNALDNRITGNSGANLLAGLEGNDTLSGGKGNDALVGGLGADELSGAKGDDLFRYATAGEGGDTVVKFNGRDDVFEVSAAGFGGGLFAGMDLVAEGRFIARTDNLAITAPGIGQFVFETDAEILWWDADGSGGAGAVIIASFVNSKPLDGDDIIVVA